jgi:uncharacterized membrane protein YfcA
VSREAIAVAYWALLLVTLTAVLVGFTRDETPVALLGSVAGAGILVALLSLRRAPERPRRVPEWSYGAMLVAAGVAAAALGAVLGVWLLVPGIAIVLLGLGLVARESRR